jgi:hypothetical protein
MLSVITLGVVMLNVIMLCPYAESPDAEWHYVVLNLGVVDCR